LIEILVDDGLSLPCAPAALEAAAEAALRAEGAAGDVAIRIAGDDAVHELNRDYRGIDSATDVLSFGVEADFALPDGESTLGDIVIALPYTARSAARQGHPVEWELQVLVVHGVLHLLGYDDEDDDANEVMLARQSAILATLS
jgi:probable rRNA maturation factor